MQAVYWSEEREPLLGPGILFINPDLSRSLNSTYYNDNTYHTRISWVIQQGIWMLKYARR